MPLGFDPQRPPGMFPWLDFMEMRVPGAAYYVLGAVGAVSGYFIGLMQTVVPLPLCVALGLLVGLLLVPIILKTMAFLLCGALIVAAAVLSFWLMDNDVARRHNAAPAGIHESVSTTGRKLLHQLFPTGGR